MQKHELRNEQPPLEEREIELLIYGVFSGFDGDKGYYYTAWVPLGDVLMSIRVPGVPRRRSSPSWRAFVTASLVRWMLPAPFQLRIPRRMAQLGGAQILCRNLGYFFHLFRADFGPGPADLGKISSYLEPSTGTNGL